jgi:hypothetical protein
VVWFWPSPFYQTCTLLLNRKFVVILNKIYILWHILFLTETTNPNDLIILVSLCYCFSVLNQAWCYFLNENSIAVLATCIEIISGSLKRYFWKIQFDRIDVLSCFLISLNIQEVGSGDHYSLICFLLYSNKNSSRWVKCTELIINLLKIEEFAIMALVHLQIKNSIIAKNASFGKKITWLKKSSLHHRVTFQIKRVKKICSIRGR